MKARGWASKIHGHGLRNRLIGFWEVRTSYGRVALVLTEDGETSRSRRIQRLIIELTGPESVQLGEGLVEKGLDAIQAREELVEKGLDAIRDQEEVAGRE